MILSTHDLWCHITRRTRCILGVIFSPNSGYTKVCYPDISIALNDQVFGFNVSMDNIFLMDVFKARNETSNKKPSSLLVESSILAYVVSQVSTRKIVHDQIQVFAVLESVVHVDNMHVLQLSENLSFIDDGLDGSLGDNSSF